MWNLGEALLASIGWFIKSKKVPVVVGGVFPTFAPDLVIQSSLVDMVCVGEGKITFRFSLYR